MIIVFFYYCILKSPWQLCLNDNIVLSLIRLVRHELVYCGAESGGRTYPLAPQFDSYMCIGSGQLTSALCFIFQCFIIIRVAKLATLSASLEYLRKDACCHRRQKLGQSSHMMYAILPKLTYIPAGRKINTTASVLNQRTTVFQSDMSHKAHWSSLIHPQQPDKVER